MVFEQPLHEKEMEMEILSQLIERAKENGSIDDFQRIADSMYSVEVSDEGELIDAFRALLYDAPQKGCGDRFASLCESFLYREDIPFASSKVLVMLCSYVHPVDKYAEYIKGALRGFEWDTERDLQSTASVLAEQLFARTQDNEIICIMIDVLHSGEENRYSYIYEALLKIVGVKLKIDWRNWVMKSPKSLIDWSLLQGLADEYRCR